MKRNFEVVRFFKLIGELTQLLGNGSVENNIGFRNGIGRTEHSELEFISRKGKG